MAGKIRDSRSGQAWEAARQQHGVLTRRQLLALGFTSKAIEHRLRTGRLHDVGQGVYAVGRPQLTRFGRWMAAVLACGDGAALSHRSAAALWGIGIEQGSGVDVSVRRKSDLRRPGIRVRIRPSLPAKDVTTRNRIPLTTSVRTLIDIATELSPNRLERAVNEADKHDLIDPESLRRALDDHAGQLGVPPFAPSSTATPSFSPTPTSRSSSARSPPRPAFPRPQQADRQRLRGRLPLPPTRPRDRDRRLALPPNARHSDQGRQAPSDPHRLRPHAAPLLPLPDRLRTHLRPQHPHPNRRPPPPRCR
ncbi:MAG: hypothetical protein QOI84_544 [Solirubrobacterales bacterium]|nr:hypothetical protein [Solirubrobacterales bacterium]